MKLHGDFVKAIHLSGSCRFTYWYFFNKKTQGYLFFQTKHKFKAKLDFLSKKY